MGQHAQRFDAVAAQRGTGLHDIVQRFKAVADEVEKWCDAHSAEVVGAMQRMEQALGLLARAPEAPTPAEEPAEEEKSGENVEAPEPTKATRRTSKAKAAEESEPAEES